MPGKKFKNTRYKGYMKSIYQMMDGDKNTFYNTLWDGENFNFGKPDPLYVGQETSIQLGNLMLNDMMRSLSGAFSTLAQEEHKTDRDLANAEKEIETYKKFFNTAFEEYKANNPKAADEEYRGVYRKLEYLDNIFKMYDASQLEFKQYEIKENGRVTGEEDLEYSAEAKVNDINENIKEYNADVEILNAYVDDYNQFVNSVEFDADILPDELKDKEVDALSAMKYGTRRISTHLDSKISDINTDLRRLEHETQEKNLETQKERDDANNILENEYQESLKMLHDKFSEEYEAASNEIKRADDVLDELNAKTEVEVTFKEKHDAYNSSEFDSVSDKFKAAGEPLPQGLDLSRDYWINNSKMITVEALDARLTKNENNISDLEKRNETIQSELATTQDELNIQKDLASHFESEINDLYSSDEYIKLNELHVEVDELNLLIDSFKENGFAEKDNEKIEKYNLKFQNIENIGEQKEIKNGLKNIYKVLGNDSKGRFSSTTLSKNLKTATLSFNQIFNKDREKFEAELKTALGDDAFKLSGEIEKYINTMADFAKVNGQVKNFEDVVNLNKISKSIPHVTELADKIPDNQSAYLKKAKADLQFAIKAYDDVMLNPDLFIDIAEVARIASSQMDLSVEVNSALQKIVDQKLEESKTLQESFDAKMNVSTTNKEKFEQGIKEREEKIENLKKEFKQNELDVKYLKASNELVKATKENEVRNADIKKAKNDKAIALKKASDVNKLYNVDAAQRLRKVTDQKISKNNKACDENIKQNKAGLEANRKPLLEELKAIEKFKEKNEALYGKQEDIGIDIRTTNNKIKELKENTATAIARVDNGRKAVLDNFNKMEADILDRISKTKKPIFDNSKEFNEMRDALSAYIEQNKQKDQKTYSQADFKLSSYDLKEKIDKYIKKNDVAPGKKKGSESGQIRLDCAKQLLQIFKQKGDILGELDAEKANIQVSTQKINEIKVTSKEVQEAIDKETEPKDLENLNLKEDLNPNRPKVSRNFAREKFIKDGMEKVKEVYKPLRDFIADKSEYLTKLYDHGVNGLQKQNYKSFAEGVACVLVGAKIAQNEKLMTALNSEDPKVSTNAKLAVDRLCHAYSSTKEVKNIADKLLHQEMDPKVFAANLSNDTFNNEIYQKVQTQQKQVANKEVTNAKGLQ